MASELEAALDAALHEQREAVQELETALVDEPSNAELLQVNIRNLCFTASHEARHVHRKNRPRQL